MLREVSMEAWKKKTGVFIKPFWKNLKYSKKTTKELTQKIYLCFSYLNKEKELVKKHKVEQKHFSFEYRKNTITWIHIYIYFFFLTFSAESDDQNISEMFFCRSVRVPSGPEAPGDPGLLPLLLSSGPGLLCGSGGDRVGWVLSVWSFYISRDKLESNWTETFFFLRANLYWNDIQWGT